MKINEIYQGDSLEVLKTFPDKSINMVMTSPPYWALRSYLPKDSELKHKELGQETTFLEYIDKLCSIFDEVKRVLKDDGTCWVNIADTYNGSGGNGNPIKQAKVTGNMNPHKIKNYPSKCLCLIPERFVVEMVARGWICRNKPIWWKRNCMPDSAKDRFTNDYENLYFFTKNQKYYFEQQFEDVSDSYANDKRPPGILRQRLYEDSKYTKGDYGNNQFKQKKLQDKGQPVNTMHLKRLNGFDKYSHVEKRNMRCVWDITTSASSINHFAMYPEKLCITPILAGCPKGGIVLDIFAGTSTTCLVAKKLNRNYIGIELNPASVYESEKRIHNETGLL